MEKAYRYRFYPTNEQEKLLRRTLGCVRLTYNKALAYRTESWYSEGERIGYGETSALLTAWKKEEELDFLNDLSSVPLQQGLRNLQAAFTNFFAGRAKYPNFKKKHHGGSAQYLWNRAQINIVVREYPKSKILNRKSNDSAFSKTP
jgi:putative transposase